MEQLFAANTVEYIMLKSSVQEILGENLTTRVKRYLIRRKQKRLKEIPFTKDDIVFVLTEICKVKKADVLFVHSSINNLMIDLSVGRCIELLMELVGPEGTILMTSYPKLTSYKFLKSGAIWDVRKTPSYVGLLTEIFRRRNEVKRSLHPTKSVAVLGPLREELIFEHHKDIKPYSKKSPYFKFVKNNGKIIGIGVSANYMSCVHTIDDYLGDDFPVETYHKEVLDGKVIDYEGNQIVVPTLVHDLNKMRSDNFGFIKRHFPKEQADYFTYKRRHFYYADAKVLFDTGVKLAREGITKYKKSVYKKQWR